jgi:multiple sugar transport system ATP-binding protein
LASVTLSKVWKIYNSDQKSAVEAVRDISLEVNSGELMAFLGPSGCGKTSILRMIAGLEAITRGIIRIGGDVVNNLTPARRNIAMAFETYALYPHMSVAENLAFCLRARKIAAAEIQDRVKRISEAVRIDHILDKRPSELPGGQQQLVSVARAMIRQPNAFLLDEPFSHIDASLRTKIRAEVKRLVNLTNTTAILVTHDQHEALAIADRVMVMNFAEIQQVGTAKDLLHKPTNIFVANFVGEPSINLIDCEVKQEGDQCYLVCLNVDGRFLLSKRVEHLILDHELSNVVVGIRPQELRLVRPEEAYVKGNAGLFEFLGEEGHLLVESGDVQLTVVTEPYWNFEKGETVGLSAEPSEIFLFDPDNEKAITHGIV